MMNTLWNSSQTDGQTHSRSDPTHMHRIAE